jgi:GMP synthase-like glutamine amidotransferase
MDNNNGRISIFDKEAWQKFLPKKLKLVTNNGNFELQQTDLTINGDLLQIIWYQNTVKGPNDANKDGEPDTIQFDVHMVKTNNGSESNPDNLKLNIDITYGDAMVSAFSISIPGEIVVSHYTGFGSKYDPDTEFGFEDETIKQLVEFFNRFGFTLDSKDFTFIDKYKDTYVYTESVKLMPSFNGDYILVVNNTKPHENRYLTNIVNYLKGRGIEHVIASNPNEVQKNNTEKVIGCLSTGSEYRLSKPESNNEFAASEEALKTLKCPILGMCYGMQHMGKQNGSTINTLDNNYNNNSILNQYDTEHPLFKGVDLKNTQVSFDFNDYLDNCPEGFKTIANLDDKIAGISNDEKKHYGLMFHPEDIEDTQPILDNFIEMCKSGRNQIPDTNQNTMKYLQTFESFRRKR